MLPAANPTSSLQRHIQNESMNATAICLTVDGDTVANKAGCRRASWYLRTVVLNKLWEVTKLMDFISHDGTGRNFLLFPRRTGLHS